MIAAPMFATGTQDILVPCRVPSIANLETRQTWRVGVSEKTKQQKIIALALRTMAQRPALPCTVTIVRIAPRPLDSDNVVSACKYIRDEIARWAHNLPDTIRVKVTFTKGPKRGRTIERDQRPPAPDGANDGIAWNVAQQRGRIPAVRIIITPHTAAFSKENRP